MKNAKQIDNIKNIVIFRTDRIGEVLLATPVIEALRERFAGAGLTFVTSAYSRDLLEDRADIDEIICFDTIEKKPPLWSAFSLASKLRKRHFDMAVIINSHRILHLAVFLAGIRYRAGFDRKWGMLLNCKTEDKRQEGMIHEVEYNIGLLKTVGIETKPRAPFMPVLSKSAFYVEGLLKQSGVSGSKKIVAIHPGSSNPKKMWPKDYFKRLIKQLVDAGNTDVILVASREEKALCNDISQGFGTSIHDLAGLFTIRKLTAMLKRCDLLVTNDNGAMHIAAAVGTKVIALFNKQLKGSNPTRWGPYGEGHKVFYKPLTDITPDEVYEAVIEKL
jgi:heptosyltransferase-2